MIEARNITKQFDTFRALDDFSITVPEGSIYGLVGPNGAGKTTLIRCVSGVYKLDSGYISVLGQPIFENAARKAEIATIPDELWFYPMGNMLDLRDFYRKMYPSFDMERFNKLRGVFPIDEKRQLRRLSKGLRKQAAFWVSICLRPRVFLLDEPVDGLDPVMRRQVWSLLMSDVAESGTTVLVSSHNLRELEDVCDHVGIMKQGRMMLEKSLSELQGGTIKLQLAFDTEEPPAFPDDWQILSHSVSGRVHLLIIRGDQQRILAQSKQLSPILVDAIALTLEEVFLYELGGEGYAVKDILL